MGEMGRETGEKNGREMGKMGGHTEARETREMIRRHEEEEEGKRRQTEGMSEGDEYRMMLMMAEKT